MRRPGYEGSSVPDTDVSVGPSVAVTGVALAAFLAYAFPLVAAAAGGATVALAATRLPSALRARFAGRTQPHGCVPGTRARIKG